MNSEKAPILSLAFPWRNTTLTIKTAIIADDEAHIRRVLEIKLKKQYLYIQAGDVNKAAKEIEALIEMIPNESEYYLLLAEMNKITY